MKVVSFLRKLRRDTRGISAVEYAILLGVVGVALVSVLGTTSSGIGGFVSDQITALTGSVGGGGAGGGTPAP